MGVAVRRYIDILIIIITFPYSTCINSFFSRSILTTFLFIYLFIFILVYVIFVQYSKTLLKEQSRSFKNQDHANIIINYIDKNVETCSRANPETSTCEVPHDVSTKLQLSLCAIMAS